jgi:hypothetical protein
MRSPIEMDYFSIYELGGLKKKQHIRDFFHSGQSLHRTELL